jgi:fermentation-respiration switch protein FrsA (DUF1100 family)
VPLISGHRNARRLIRADLIAAVQTQFDADRRARYAGKAAALIPVVAQDPTAPCALPTPDSWWWFTETGTKRAPAWRNEVTLQSVELFTEYEPGAYIEWISPTPFMMVVAAGDHLTVSDEALAAFARALEPKKLVLLTGGHFDAYVKDFESASGNARDWFVQHLGAKVARGTAAEAASCEGGTRHVQAYLDTHASRPSGDWPPHWEASGEEVVVDHIGVRLNTPSKTSVWKCTFRLSPLPKRWMTVRVPARPSRMPRR